MTARPVHVTREIHPSNREISGRLLLGDAVSRLEGLLPEFEGKVKLIYMDPPFMTGDRFFMRLRVGAEGWRGSRANFAVPSYRDLRDREEYLSLLRAVLTLCRRLLREDGMIFVHVDYRADAHVRLLMDELFGERNFLNEIIWVYQSGGRSVRHFSRKHDVILFYARSQEYDFNIDAVMSVPKQPRSNHMRRHVDPDGRVYRSIRANGKVYTYYDDDPVAPTDVWADLNHLQQKDPERTGYDNQKPLALLERIVRCASHEGEWVLDPFAGSATTLEAARRNGRRFLGVERCALSLNIASRRLAGCGYALEFDAPAEDAPACRVSVRAGVGFYHASLEAFEADTEGLPEGAGPLDAVDGWSLGYLREDGYHVMDETLRTRRAPELREELAAPVYDGQLMAAVSDVRGRTWYYAVALDE